MNTLSLTRDNHFVPRTYLRGWANTGGKLWVYRTLVSRASVPEWRAHSVRGVAHHEHLYTQFLASGESDAVEQWLATRIDSPAAQVLQRVAEESRLTAADWDVLLDFFAASQARTPASLLRRIPVWNREMQPMIDKTLRESAERLERGELVPAMNSKPTDEPFVDFPVNVRAREGAEGEDGVLELEVLLGRKLWLYELQRLVLVTSRQLRKSHWTILRARIGQPWLTSDDPVLCLNYSSPQSFSFTGGWGSPGTDLVLPLSPRHVLYTKIGSRVPVKYSPMPIEAATAIQRMTVLHAHRMVFAVEPDDIVMANRLRQVDHEAVERERREWEQFHSTHSEAEAELAAGRWHADRTKDEDLST